MISEADIQLTPQGTQRAERLAGDSPGRLAHVANQLAASDEHGELAEQARAQAHAQLEQQCQAREAPASALVSLANYYRRQGEYDTAVEHLRRALILDYDQVGWRYTLAQVLTQAGRAAEALHEAKICVRLQPEFKAARRLVDQLSVDPVTLKQQLAGRGSD